MDAFNALPAFESESNQTEQIALMFSDILKEWLTEKEMQKAIERNASEKNACACHTHDFCDPNIAIFEAYEIILGKGKTLDFEILNSAWQIAKDNNFWNNQ